MHGCAGDKLCCRANRPRSANEGRGHRSALRTPERCEQPPPFQKALPEPARLRRPPGTHTAGSPADGPRTPEGHLPRRNLPFRAEGCCGRRRAADGRRLIAPDARPGKPAFPRQGVSPRISLRDCQKGVSAGEGRLRRLGPDHGQTSWLPAPETVTGSAPARAQPLSGGVPVLTAQPGSPATEGAAGRPHRCLAAPGATPRQQQPPRSTPSLCRGLC